MKNVKIARINMVYVGKAWIKCKMVLCQIPVLVDVSRAWLRGNIRRTLFISSWMKRCLYPPLMRCVVNALRPLLKKSSVEQILLSRNAMLKGIEF